MAPTWLQQAREVGPRPQLGDVQLDGADPGVPLPLPVAVAIGEPVGHRRDPPSALVQRSTWNHAVSRLRQGALDLHHYSRHNFGACRPNGDGIVTQGISGAYRS